MICSTNIYLLSIYGTSVLVQKLITYTNDFGEEFGKSNEDHNADSTQFLVAPLLNDFYYGKFVHYHMTNCNEEMSQGSSGGCGSSQILPSSHCSSRKTLKFVHL